MLGLIDWPMSAPALRTKAAICGLLGETEEGRACVDRLLVLNPDTEVDRRCLSELMAKSVEGFGMVGASLVFDHAPDTIINYGLHWSRMTVYRKLAKYQLTRS